MEKKEFILELTVNEMVTLLKYLREDVIVNVTIDEEGGDPDGRREEL